MSFESSTDSNGSNLSTRYLASVFNDKSTSYKLFWFRALLEVLKQRATSAPIFEGKPILVSELLTEMLAAAWHPVCYFRLSLGSTDKLQNACEKLRTRSGLAPSTKHYEIRSFIVSSPDVLDDLWNLVTYVPALFLTPWFASEMRGISAGTDRVKKAAELAFDFRNTTSSSIYWLDGRGKDLSVVMDPRWELFAQDNIGLLEGFADHHLCDYLQSRNPSSPAIIHKLALPLRRYLGHARSFWNYVRDALVLAGEREVFRDIYSGKRLDSDFSIDHFLPWSFVAHDQLWNLAPVSGSTNSAKGDRLPDIECYLSRLANLHWHALKVIREKCSFHDDYISSFTDNITTLIDGGEVKLFEHYRRLVIPQAQLAMNQGFDGGWKLPES